MIDTLKTDTLTSISNEVASKLNADASSYDYWFWIAMLEFVIIFYIVFIKKNKETVKEKFKRDAKSTEVDFDNIINSSFNVKPLYHELKVKCHPDRFPNDKIKNEIALTIFQEIEKNKTDYKKLIELRELAKHKLNINF